MIPTAEAFARERHAGQTRKGAAAEPYIVHVEEVARLTAGWGGSETAVMAAWLHDTVEDCPPTSLDEIAGLFGADVARIVGELTDDKSLPKAERKRLQVVNAAHKSPEACLVKIADKTSNVSALRLSPPADWSRDRMRAYLDWVEAVMDALAHKPEGPLSALSVALSAARAGI
jgi:(p)ppGpp synthase/HD superfamily hydrolase